MLSLKQVGITFAVTDSKICVLSCVHACSSHTRSSQKSQCLFRACPLVRQRIPGGHLRLFAEAMEAPFQPPVDCSVDYLIMKMFSLSAIITDRQPTPILFSSAYPLLTRGWKTKKSHSKFPFKVVYEFCLNRFFALTDDFLKESSLL